MRTVSTTLHTSKKIVSASARLGGRTVRVVGKTAKRTIKLPAETVKKVKLMKQKLRHLNKAVAKDKLKKAAAASGKFIVKSAKYTVKSTVKAAGNAADSLTDSINNDTVRFAKQSYNAARSAASAAKKAGKATGKTIKTSAKTVRTLATKKGRRELAKSVNRRVQRINRNIRRIKAAPKKIGKAAKRSVNAIIRLIRVGARFIGFLLSTLPWSLILAGVVAIVLLTSYLVTNCYTFTLASQERVAGWALDESDTPEDIYSNIKQLALKLMSGCENKFSKDLKDEISGFCISVSDPQRIIEYTVGDTSATLFPAVGGDSTINPIIDSVINDFSRHTSTEYSDFMAALVVLTARKNLGNESFVLEKFTQAEIEEFIGGLNSNSCSFGSTFFVKTTATTTGETCPNADCKTKKERGCDCGGKDENGNKVCKGHPYCDNDHEKMTVKFQTADKYYGKSISEIYNFTEEEASYFADVSDFIRIMLMEMSMSNSGGDSR